MRPNSGDSTRETNEDNEKVTNVLAALRLPRVVKPATAQVAQMLS